MDSKTLIICQSVHHGNTMKVARVVADELGAEIKRPHEADNDDVEKHDLIGFGSGIYRGKHHESLFELVGRLTPQGHKKAFIFSTALIPSGFMHNSLRDSLAGRGFDIVGEFQCKGFSDYSFMRYMFGGLNKGRPNGEDLNKARNFARKMKGT
jgi:flavodoxin